MGLRQDIERLRRTPVFACLEPEALKLVAFSAVARRLPSGHVLFRRGEVAEAAVLLAAGTLALDDEAEAPGGTVRWAQAETLLNEAALFAPGVQVATATAHGDCTVVSVPRALVARVLDLYPDNAAALRRYWAARLRARLAAVRAAAPP